MSPLQRRIATVTKLTANLVSQLRELDQAREQVRKARRLFVGLWVVAVVISLMGWAAAIAWLVYTAVRLLAG